MISANVFNVKQNLKIKMYVKFLDFAKRAMSKKKLIPKFVMYASQSTLLNIVNVLFVLY
jgi:hypothetical protein